MVSLELSKHLRSGMVLFRNTRSQEAESSASKNYDEDEILQFIMRLQRTKEGRELLEDYVVQRASSASPSSKDLFSLSKLLADEATAKGDSMRKVKHLFQPPFSAVKAATSVAQRDPNEPTKKAFLPKRDPSVP